MGYPGSRSRGNGSGQFLGPGASGAWGPSVRAMLWPGQWVMDEFWAAHGRCPPALVTAA